MINSLGIRVTPELEDVEEKSSLVNRASAEFVENDAPHEGSLKRRSTLTTKTSKVLDFLESKTLITIMTLATIYTLFGSDVNSLAFSKSADDVFSAFVAICLFLFLTPHTNNMFIG